MKGDRGVLNQVPTELLVKKRISLPPPLPLVAIELT